MTAQLGETHPDPTRTHRRWARWIALAVVLAILTGIGLSQWRAAITDSDNDGITDQVELAGWRIADGTEYRTDPNLADTDADGLTDLDEAGTATTASSGDTVYSGYSDPLRVDTDSDGVDDAAEADSGLNPRRPDMDGDALSDGYEVEVAGTDPESPDTDGDGLLDGYEDADPDDRGLDPRLPDEQVSQASFEEDFAKGLLAGELSPEDSLGWLAGNLFGAGAGAFTVAGSIADLRDALGSALHGDWVGSGVNALGALPLTETVTIPRKVAAFVERYPKRAAEAAALVMKASAVPEWLKIQVARVIWRDWDQLVSSGANERALLRLQMGRTDLAKIVEAQIRKGHVAGPPVSAAGRMQDAAEKVVALYRKVDKALDVARRLSTSGCSDCGGDVRVPDAVIDGVAHTTKVGYVVLTDQVRRQILKDAWLIRSGTLRGAHWHFVASSHSDTLGADPGVLDLLDAAGIRYTIHLPADE